MGESLRKPLFIIAGVLLALAVLTELGSPLVQRIVRRAGNAASEIQDTLASVQSMPQLRDVPADEIKAKMSGGTERPPGRGVPYMVLLDGLVLFTVILIGASLLFPERIHGRIQGVVTLFVSLAFLLASIGKIFAAVAALVLMVTLLLAVPFGTLIYLIGYGSFDRGLATVILSVIMTFKLGFAICLILAHQGFVKMKGLVLIILTSIVAGIAVSFLHGLVPGILVSITDAIAGIVVGILAALWALFFLIGSIPSIVKSIKLSA